MYPQKSDFCNKTQKEMFVRKFKTPEKETAYSTALSSSRDNLKLQLIVSLDFPKLWSQSFSSLAPTLVPHCTTGQGFR